MFGCIVVTSLLLRLAYAIPTAECTATTFAQVEPALRACNGGAMQFSDIQVPAGEQLNFSNMKPGTTITLAGKIDFAPSKGRGADKVLIMVAQSEGLQIIGAEGMQINGHGEAYWDGSGGNGGAPKPKFLRIQKCNNCLISGLRILNGPVHTIAVSNCKGTTLDNIVIDDRAGNKPCAGEGKACGHNTDGFGVSGSSNITIQNSKVYNQDDCLAVNSGSGIKFLNNYCEGGHGISIGSIKSNQHVSDVTVSNCTIAKSENGVRIKTYDDATGASVSNIKYEGITLQGITKYGIIIQQDYRNGGPTGKAGSSVPIKGVTLTDIKGTMASGKNNKVYVLCGMGTCTNWKWSGINITGGGGSQLKTPPCRNADASVQSMALCKE